VACLFSKGHDKQLCMLSSDVKGVLSMVFFLLNSELTQNERGILLWGVTKTVPLPAKKSPAKKSRPYMFCGILQSVTNVAVKWVKKEEKTIKSIESTMIVMNALLRSSLERLKSHNYDGVELVNWLKGKKIPS
jgi:hypothetical protein